MASSTEDFLVALLRSDNIKDALLPCLSTEDICALRQTSSACCNLLTKRVFTRIHVSFSSSTFTRPARVAALGRIGQHIEHLTFYLPHSQETFLPPLIHPVSGNEISFLYTPHTSMGSVLSRPKYANSELGEILTQQYPPLFHAATNVPSFINAMRLLPNMRHLTIRCPGQEPSERYRRSIVDYALISLRISLERAPLVNLHKLSLSHLHPAAFTYLRHVHGFGSVPSAGRRWKQICKLSISVDAWDFYGSTPGLDHLKIIDDYIRSFAPNLEKFSFSWLGRKGPCPIALSGDPLFAPPRITKKLFNEVTSLMSPLPTRPSRGPIHFPKLRCLQIRNSTMYAPQLSQLITSHRHTVKEFDFASVSLAKSGNWDEALAPLDNDSLWSRSSTVTSTTTSESEYSVVTSPSEEYLPSPSAAVAAASRELMDFDLGGYGFGDLDRELMESLLEARQDEDEDIPIHPEAESEFGESFSTRFKKRSRRRRRKHRSEEETIEQPATSLSRKPSTTRRSPFHWAKPSRLHLKTSIEEEFVRPETPVPIAAAAVPILNNDPQPTLLQPTIYDPMAKPTATVMEIQDEDISPVLRNVEQEQAHRLFAEDVAARTSALRKAKAAVLTKLSLEFCNNKKVGPVEPNACRLLAGRDLGTMFGSNMVMEDCRSLESRSLLVPLMFSRT